MRERITFKHVDSPLISGSKIARGTGGSGGGGIAIDLETFWASFAALVVGGPLPGRGLGGILLGLMIRLGDTETNNFDTITHWAKAGSPYSNEKATTRTEGLTLVKKFSSWQPSERIIDSVDRPARPFFV